MQVETDMSVLKNFFTLSYTAIIIIFLWCGGVIADRINTPKEFQSGSFELVCQALKKQLNEDLEDKNFDDNLKTEIARVLNRDLWHKFSGSNWTIDKVTDRLAKKINGPKQLLYVQDLGPRAEKMILRLRKHLDCVSNHLSENWTKEYILKIEELNKRQIRNRDYQDERQSIRSSIDSLISLTQRLRTIDDVHNQHLEGIPTNILVLGMAQSTDKDKVIPIQVYRNIRDSAETFLSANRSIKSIFSESRLTSKGFKRKFIHHKSSKIEDSGANPIEYTDSKTHTHYVLQKYKIFPVFPKPIIVQKEQETVNDDFRKNSAIQKAKASWHKTPAYFVVDDIDEKSIPRSDNNIIRRNAREMLQQIEKENQTSQNRIRSSEKNFMSNRHDIWERRQLELQNLVEFIRNSKSMILKLNPTVQFEYLYKNQDRIINSDIDDIEKIKNVWGVAINNFLNTKRNLFENRVESARAGFEKHIQGRPLIIFTREDEIQNDDISRKQLAVKLAEKAVRSLCLRQRSLVSYRVSVFRDGKLESQRADKYYDNGTITASIMVFPVVQHIDYLDGTRARISILLAHEIQFRRAKDDSASAGPVFDCKIAGEVSVDKLINDKPAVKTKNQGGLAKKMYRVRDMKEGLEWLLMPSKRCRLKNDYENYLLTNFSLPTFRQLSLLRAFLQRTNKSEIRRRFQPLLKDGRYLWSRKSRSVLKDEYLVFNLMSGKYFYEPSDACNFAVGVRPFG